MPKVALIGRPNVGKSTLFNRLIRSNRAITHDMPGVTRDRMEGTVKRSGKVFTLIDTGGITLDSHSAVTEGPAGIRGFEAEILRQSKEAMEEADLLCFVVDGRDGLTPFDDHLANYLRKAGKPILLIVNKVDGEEKAELLMSDFHILGFQMLPCSAEHGFNLRALDEEILSFLHFPEAEFEAYQEKIQNKENENNSELETNSYDPDIAIEVQSEEPSEEEQVAEELQKTLRLALLGRPNAGKSSLVNALSKTERMIVSDIAGTTRDSVDISTNIKGKDYVFVDTAGIRRRSKITDTVERYSVNSSLKSSSKAHVTLLVIDGTDGLTQQDKRLLELLDERKTPFIVLVNKYDLVSKDKQKIFAKDYKEALVYCQHVPLLFVSAKTGFNLAKIVPLATEIRKEYYTRIGTGKLNKVAQEALLTHQPPTVKGRRSKFFYMTQAEIAPPTFVFFVSDAERIPDSYAKFLEKNLRNNLGIKHAPIRLKFRSSHGQAAKDRKEKKQQS
ncbi:ribosome biogenesis GTPase Der [Desulfovibrio litoralis]|nr:ribosome biogenesis GTPase Der [Desulfovibrio litoralis]